MTTPIDNPLVSVIIPVQNGEKFLVQAIESVLVQDYEPFELLIILGNSADRTEEIARAYNEARCILQEGQGIAGACNTGIHKAQGSLVAFLSHDDIWKPKKLSTQVGYMLEHPKLQYTTARVKFFQEPGFDLPSGFRRELLEGDHVGHILETLVAKRNVFKKVGYFDSKVKFSLDVDWFSRVKDMHIPTAVIPEILLLKRVHDSNVSIISKDNTYLLRSVMRSIQRKKIMKNRDE
ncbi:MAG: glycosyltransferase [Candidatus Neomarinimicrobiota bacterium]